VAVGCAGDRGRRGLVPDSEKISAHGLGHERHCEGFRRTVHADGGDGQPFSSASLAGKPYAIYFGFTRCGDVCPTTLGRLVKLRGQAGGEKAINIVFVTIDPTNDGPKEVGQYAGLFNSPIIGLTGSPEQIARVKKQYGIFAQPSPHPMAGKEMEHTATVLLFDREGKLASTIATDEPDSAALAKMKRLTV
jgi:protein SCO1/2